MTTTDSGLDTHGKASSSLSTLPWRPIAILILIALIFGINMAVVKIGSREMAPLFMAGIRSVISALCLLVWMKIKGIKVFPSAILSFHGLIAGLLFGSEFGFLFVGLGYTTVSRMSILLYTSPFFVALGAHLFLANDKINFNKALGLLLAFAGTIILFSKGFGSLSSRTLIGDFMGLTAGLLWAATTVYIKKYLTDRTEPLQTLFYQLFFSAPLLLIFSLILEDQPVTGLTYVGILSMAFQSIIVAFLSFLIWFELVRRYPVSLLHAFLFFTPIFGVTISGVLILKEQVGIHIILSLVFVCLGMVFVNREKKPKETS